MVLFSFFSLFKKFDKEKAEFIKTQSLLLEAFFGPEKRGNEVSFNRETVKKKWRFPWDGGIRKWRIGWWDLKAKIVS